MSVTEPPKDTPFGLDQNVAAGLAYLFTLLGGIIMLVGGGTNKFVKWAAAQSITLWGGYIVFEIALGVLNVLLGIMHLWALWPITTIIGLIAWILALVAWIWTTITGFQGKEVRLPFIADLTARFFPQAA